MLSFGYLYMSVLYHLFALMVTLVHKFMTYLQNILRYFVAKDKMFSVDGGMNWAYHVI